MVLGEDVFRGAHDVDRVILARSLTAETPLRVPLVVVAGPTAAGKTDVAQRVAERLGQAPILSADSMQVYTGMDIGTGKIAPEERTVEYYGLDLVDPGMPYSASLFQEYGRNVVASLDRAGGRCVVCGGTGFYIRALIDSYRFPAGEQVDNSVRIRYQAIAEEQGAEAVWGMLQHKDADSADLIPVRDTKRVIRALELHEQGLSYALQKQQLQSLPSYYPVCFIGLSVDPDILVTRIESRVDRMFEAGLVSEVEGLLNAGLRDAITANQAIGYKEVVDALEGAITMDEARTQIKTATRRYAKRQRTWFRKEARLLSIDANDGSVDRISDIVCEAVTRFDEAYVRDYRA